MADETLRFDIVGDDQVSEPLSRAAESAGKLSRAMDAAARQSAIMDEALKRQGTAARVSVDATLSLARADKILEDAEHGLRDGALEAEFALKRQADAAKKAGDAADKAAAQNKGLQASLQKVADSAKGGGGPAWLGPGLLGLGAIGTVAGVGAGAAIGLAGAFTAGAAALAAFGAVAKPVLSSALTAEQAVNTAQNNYNATIAAGVPTAQAQANLQKANASAQLTYNAAIAGGANPAKALAAEHLALAKNQLAYNSATSTGTFNAKAYAAEQLAIGKAYADLSPQQIALSKQLGNMAQAWQDLKAAQTPVVAGALQPWLKAVTDLTKNLGLIIAAVAPVIGDIGHQIDVIINSSAFPVFRDFIANIGSQAVAAAGNLLTGFLDATITLLPQFTPLIQSADRWLSGLGDSLAHWASSQKTADQILAFMNWFHQNSPAVGTLLTNLGGALKALAPGLTAGGAIELKVISDFLGWVAKLPKDIAKPLAEVTGALLLLNKLGVFSVGVKIIGPAAKWLSGGLINIGGGVTAGAEIRAAMVSGGAAAAAEIRAAMAGGAVPGAAGGAAGKGAAGAGGAASGLAATAGELLGIISLAALAGTAIGEIFSKITTGKFENFAQWKVKFLSSLDSMRHAAASFGDGVVQDWNLVWANTITRTAKGFHDLAGWFDTGRHDIAAHMNQIMSNVIDAWNKIWNNTIARIQRGFHDTAGLFDTGRHTIAATFDNIRHDIAAKWDQIWADTASKVRAGIASVVTFFTGLPGKITGVLGNALTVLKSWGAGVITGLLQGMNSVITQVWDFIKGIPGKILSFLGIKSPPQWAIDAGKHIMNGLGIGMAQAQGVFTKASAAGAAAAGAAAAGALGGGVQRWRSLVLQALKMEGLPASLVNAVLYQMQTESGGNPAAINLTDSNAAAGDPSRGLMQVIATTFAKYHWPGTSQNIYDPLANIAAALNYAAHNAGFGSGPGQIGSGHGYALGTLNAMPGWAMVGERGPEMVRFRGGEQVLSNQGWGTGAGQGDLLAELRALRAEVRQLTGVAAAIPARTGQHVGSAIGGAAAQGSFNRRYP